MKGVAPIILAVAVFACSGMVVATPPILPPVQYEQFCEAQKVSGTGVIDASTSIIDKKIALEYYNAMAGDGDLELDQEHAYSQNADKLKRNISSVNDGNESNLNLFEKTKMTYSGKTPLAGEKYLQSKDFYGGIGANVREIFSVNEMEKDETSFFASTAPSHPHELCDPATMLCPEYYPDYYRKYYSEYFPPAITPGNLVKALKDAGSDEAKVSELMGNNPTHLIGIETKNSFNGTWGTDATWHKIFYKDIKAQEIFTGKFEVEKTIKFHESPVPENLQAIFDGIDC
jgi:hypothetical protein